MKIRPVGAELFHVDERTNRLTDLRKLIVAFRDFAKALQNRMSFLDFKLSSCSECCMLSSG